MKRRWGWYQTLLKGKQFKVKLLYFEKDKSISMQKHNHRSELWLFIFGHGLMNVSKNVQHLVHKGESVTVPRGQWHRFIAKEPTLVLEVQYGGHCSERDIQRI